MRTTDFFEIYDLKTESVYKVWNVGHDLYLLLDINVELDLIANGYRPNMDMNVRNLYIFKDSINKNIEIYYPKVQSVIENANNTYTIVFDKGDLTLKNGLVSVKANYELINE